VADVCKDDEGGPPDQDVEVVGDKMNTPKEKGLCTSLTHSTIMYPFKTIYLQWEPQTSAYLVAIACSQAYLSRSAEERAGCAAGRQGLTAAAPVLW
jgi:hypothetical protein